MNCVERRDTLQLSDRFLERNKYFRVAVVMIEIDDGFRKTRKQLAQKLSLYRREIEESVNDKKLHLRQPRHLHESFIDHAAQHPQRAQLFCIFFCKVILIQQVRVSGVDECDFPVEIELRDASGFTGFFDVTRSCSEDVDEFRRGASGALDLAQQRGNTVHTSFARGERRKGGQLVCYKQSKQHLRDQAAL